VKIYLKTPTAQQQKFIDASEREQLYGGAKRGGKTVAGAMKAVLLSIMFPGNRGLIGRKDMTDLKDTSLTTFFDICPPELILDHHKGDRKIVIRTSDKPSEILYRGLGDQSDVEKAKGIDLGWSWIDEPSEIEEETYKMLRSQLNWQLPDGKRPPYMMLLTSNPEPGWVKRRFIDNMIDGGVFIPSLPRDNPHLPPGWENELRASYDADWVEKYLNGSWNVSEGSVFPELNETVHAIDKVDFRYMKFVSGMDHGSTGVTACVQVAIDADENVFVLEEYYVSNQLISRHARDIKLMLDSYGKQEYTVIDPSTEAKTLQGQYELRSVIDEYHRNALPVVPAWRASIDVGINLNKEYLHVHPQRRHPFTQQAPSPRLFIVKRKCPNLWREMMELRKEVTGTGDMRFAGQDHALDAFRYVCMSRPRAPKGTEAPQPEISTWDRMKLTSEKRFRENWVRANGGSSSWW
jgi:PBSX family phage terminase large subunit